MQCVQRKVGESLEEFGKHGAMSVAFPAIGTGKLGYSLSEVATQMIKTCSKYFQMNPHTSIKKILFVIYPTDDLGYKVYMVHMGCI